jgi:hypothetical protein
MWNKQFLQNVCSSWSAFCFKNKQADVKFCSKFVPTVLYCILFDEVSDMIYG